MATEALGHEPGSRAGPCGRRARVDGVRVVIVAIGSQPLRGHSRTPPRGRPDHHLPSTGAERLPWAVVLEGHQVEGLPATAGMGWVVLDPQERPRLANSIREIG